MLTCARCGEQPAHVERAYRGGVTGYYCFDETADVDCFTLSKWAGFPELELD